MNPIGSASGAAGIRDILALRQQIIDKSQLLQQVNMAPVEHGNGAQGVAGGFADTLTSALNKVNESQVNSETLSAGYERGDVTDIAKVMMARQEAGIAFEATLQVRNRLLTAYQEIMRMGV